jgi:hypothetical protein
VSLITLFAALVVEPSQMADIDYVLDMIEPVGVDVA